MSEHGQLTKLLISLVLLIAFKLSVTGQLGTKEHVYRISNFEEHVTCFVCDS